MATKVFMEALSPTMEEGRLVKWLKAEGDAITSGDILAEVETDKAIMELVARGDGVLRKRLIGDGDTRPVGEVIGVIAAADEDISALTGGSGGSETAAPAPAAKPDAEPAAKPDAEPAASTAKDEAAASTAGEETTSSAGAAKPTTAPAAPAPAAKAAATQSESPSSGRARSSPLARRLATEKGLDLASVQGTGPGGRIIKRDVESARQSAPAAAAPGGRVATDGAAFEDVPLTQIRKTIARRLAESIGPVPTFYLTAEFDMERIADMRTAMAELGDEYKVSYNDIMMKAIATALVAHPECNAHWGGDHIRYWNGVHLGMAVAIPDGLITPVIFDADRKRLREIAAESKDLAKRARERHLKPDEYTGSTFSVSNLGMFGIDHFTAIINPPEAGILAIGGMEARAVVVDGAVVVRRRMRVTMSCDHRVIDGALGAKFLQTLRQLVENPLLMTF